MTQIYIYPDKWEVLDFSTQNNCGDAHAITYEISPEILSKWGKVSEQFDETQQEIMDLFMHSEYGKQYCHINFGKEGR